MKHPDAPAIPGYPYAIAFQANTGVLWTYTPAGSAVATTETVQTGTSPSITVY